MRYIVEVARAESITTAAQVLAISQPALTRNIAEVEEELGIQLFHRLPRGIQLTEDGGKFIARARQILSDVDNLVAEMREPNNTPSGRLRVGFTPAGYVGNVRHILQQFAIAYPEVALDIATGSAQDICQRLSHGELHMIIGSSSYLERWRDLDVNHITAQHFACVFRKNHPICQMQEITEEDVLEYPLILPESVDPMYSDIAQRYIHLDLPRKTPRYVVEDFDTIMRLVNSTNAFFPWIFPDPDFLGMDKHFFLLKDVVKIPTHHLSVAYASQRPKTAAARLLEEMVRKDLG